jgi:BirA family biotin operon repressor/biotin-[acetyl-CoA-carboxylase] ligase
VRLRELYPLLRRLADGEFHSGQALAEAFGVTRAAIWKQVQALNEVPGIDIQSVRGKGYRLQQTLQLLDHGRISARLPEGALAQLELLPETVSTNDWLRDQATPEVNSGRACLAEYQRGGRGRRGRRWVCAFGSNIYLSLAWRFDLAMADLAGLSLAAGVGVARVLEAHGLKGHGLKWPNDIYLEGKKLGGILVEASGEMEGPALAIIGVGINLQLEKDVAAGIDQPWTDMASALDCPADRNLLCGDLLAELIVTCRQFQNLGLSHFLDEWKAYDIHLGQRVELHLGSQVIPGIYRGLDERGGLVLETSGEQRSWYAGEVSLRSQENK